MKKTDLSILERKDLIRSCKLIDSEWWKEYLNEDVDKKSNRQLRNRIYDKINPDGEEWRDQYKNALGFFDITYTFNTSVDEMKEKLYKHSCKKIEERMSDMSEEEKESLTDQLEDELDEEDLKRVKEAGSIGIKVGTGAKLMLKTQIGVIAITGSNLGVCLLLTSGLSSISSVVGITFPFAVYAGAAAAGGKAMAVAGIIANPAVVGPVAAAGAAGIGYYEYSKWKKKQYAYLAGVNYLVESKKLLM